VSDLMAVIDGKPIPLEACGWFQREKCGCIIAALVAVTGNTVYATAEQAHRHMARDRRTRDRDERQGRTWELLPMDFYRQHIGANWECSQHSNPPLPPCDCGQPIPAGRKATCSRECRFADDDHGPDVEPEGAES
jgi:hypothetical protein